MFMFCSGVCLVLAVPNHHYRYENTHHTGADSGQRNNQNYHVKLDSPFQKIKNSTSQWYTEFFVVATGDHLYSPELPSDIHVSARAAILLSQKLHAMTEVYALLANTSVHFALGPNKFEDKDSMVKFVNEIVAHVKKNPSLSVEYESIRNVLSESFVSYGKYFTAESKTSSEVKAQSFDQWTTDPFMRAAILNKMFFVKSFRDDHHTCKIAKSVLQQASNPEIHDQLESIYSEAVARTVKVVCPAHEKEKAERILFSNLMDMLAEDGVLSVKLFGNKKFMLLNYSVLW